MKIPELEITEPLIYQILDNNNLEEQNYFFTSVIEDDVLFIFLNIENFKEITQTKDCKIHAIEKNFIQDDYTITFYKKLN
jgi:hypothetical protein